MSSNPDIQPADTTPENLSPAVFEAELLKMIQDPRLSDEITFHGAPYVTVIAESIIKVENGPNIHLILSGERLDSTEEISLKILPRQESTFRGWAKGGKPTSVKHENVVEQYQLKFEVKLEAESHWDKQD